MKIKNALSIDEKERAKRKVQESEAPLIGYKQYKPEK